MPARTGSPSHGGFSTSRCAALRACVVACFAAPGAPALAQTDAPLPAAQRGGTFVEPPAVIDPAYIPSGPNAPARAAGSGAPLTLRLALELPLDAAARGVGIGRQGSRSSRGATLQAELTWRSAAYPGWFAQGRFFRDLSGGRQPWHPDVAYAFGYERYEPGTFSLVYSNYTGTRLHPLRLNFNEGQLSAGYKFALPEAVQPLLLAGDGDTALCSANLQWTGHYNEAATGAPRDGRPSIALGCRYTHPSGWFGHFTALAWRRSEQQPWDPDFTYGLGYAPPQWPGFVVEYANYSGNRWPGRDAAPGEGRLRSGSLLLGWTTSF
ncbi:hypothetical protein [Ramlibacter albus]|uniref:Porin n=1 Tax=Ramlibacter albus TaxID=2079448 RepID=A0A923M4U3_9BURK|nr:hypothetical protein [Ramlibacter albus]MBC5764217.1 hypothetical protein [Ramlibacter albus]